LPNLQAHVDLGLCKPAGFARQIVGRSGLPVEIVRIRIAFEVLIELFGSGFYRASRFDFLDKIGIPGPNEGSWSLPARLSRNCRRGRHPGDECRPRGGSAGQIPFPPNSSNPPFGMLTRYFSIFLVIHAPAGARRVEMRGISATANIDVVPWFRFRRGILKIGVGLNRRVGHGIGNGSRTRWHEPFRHMPPGLGCQIQGCDARCDLMPVPTPGLPWPVPIKNRAVPAAYVCRRCRPITMSAPPGRFDSQSGAGTAFHVV